MTATLALHHEGMCDYGSIVHIFGSPTWTKNARTLCGKVTKWQVPPEPDAPLCPRCASMAAYVAPYAPPEGERDA
jgi:hypothetical protein